jgi:hypothetical protein
VNGSAARRKGEIEATAVRPAREPPEKEIGRFPQERALIGRMVWPKLLDGSPTAEEVEQNGDYGKNQQNVDESAGDVKRSETQQPQY